MPNIPGYDQPNLGLQPTEEGIRALTQSAYRGRALLDEAAASVSQAGAKIGAGLAAAGAAAVQYESHREISAGAAHGAQLLANLTDDWNDTAKNADPNDPSVAAKWREEKLEPALKKFQGGFNTEQSQQWSEHYTEQVRNHLFQKTTADMSSLAAQAAENNIHTVANTYSNTAINDPSAVPFLLDSVDHQIGGLVDSSPNIKGAEAAKLKLAVAEKTKEAIVKAGVYGAILNSKDPEAVAAAWSQKYPQYINGAEAEVFARAARTQARTNLAMEKQAQLYQKQLDTLAVDQARNKIWSDNVSIDADGKVNIKPDFFRQAAQLPAQHLNAPNATETAKTLLDWGEHQQRLATQPVRIASDSATVHDLDSRMFLAEGQTTEMQIIKAESAHKLSRQDAQQRLAIVRARDTDSTKDPAFKAAMDGARAQIEMNAGGLKIGADKYAAFMQSFLAEYQKQKRAGTLPPNWGDLTDPNSLISQSVKPYRMGIGEAVSANGGVSAPAPAPAKAAAPAIGAVKAGYRFKGGDPSKPESWEKVQ